jgi:polygalacturonase
MNHQNPPQVNKHATAQAVGQPSRLPPERLALDSTNAGATPAPQPPGSRRRFLGRLLGAGSVGAVVTASFAAEEPPRQTGASSVREFGAVGDGKQLDTKALQKAIDTCAAAGGGTVFFPAGRYLTGTLFLKSRVTLHLEAGAVLLGSPKLEDYPATVPSLRSYTDNYTERSLLYAENLENIAICGQGVIDGQGSAFKGRYKLRPYLMRWVSCRDVSVRGITVKDSPMWVQHYLACEGVLIDGIRVTSTCNGNNDGIDIDGCERVRIANCDIRSGDDAIVLKSTLDRPCKNVVITNCALSSLCNAFKLGTESNGGFENIALSNCTIYDTRLSGIALELVDGGTLERVTVSNVTLHNTRNAIFIRLGNRARPFKEGMAAPGVGRLRHVRISDVQAFGADVIGCSITGLPDSPVEDIALDNVSVSLSGGGTMADARREPPEQVAKYPEYAMFERLPAYGFFCRHARGLRLSRVQVDVVKPDARPSLVCDDVRDLEIFGWRAPSANESPTMVLRNVQEALIHGCQAAAKTGTYLRSDGKRSRKITLLANDLSEAAQAFTLGPEAPNAAVTMPKPAPEKR